MLLDKFMNKKSKALIPFLVAGDPSFEATEKLVTALVDNGADILELGVPFSDAMADGPVIQAASERASKKNGSVFSVLELAKTLKTSHPQLGLVIFSYFNPLMKVGLREFAKRANESGVQAVLTVDLPPEEAQDYKNILTEQSVGTIFLASPTTSRDRLKLIDELSSEFIYYISRAGVTGIQSELSSNLEAQLRTVRERISKPLAVGFGISNGEQAARVAPFVDGVVVGSAFVKIVAEAKNIDAAVEDLGKLARQIKIAIRGPQ